MSSEYLCQAGISEYNRGRYESALAEFRKALLVEPQNQIAKNYIRNIFNRELVPATEFPKTAESREEAINRALNRQAARQQPQRPPPANRDDIIANTLMQLGADQPFKDKEKKFIQKKNLEVGGLTITGNAQLSGGFTPDVAIWKRANANLNEENYRIISTTAFDQKTNTYDPRIYDRLNVNLDTDNAEGINLHGNITVDPWSFTGKSSKFTVTSLFGDTAEIELKYWSNTGYTIGQTIYTSRLGNVIQLPETKVVDGQSYAFGIKGAFNNPSDVFIIPAQKIDMQFQPLREIWTDYTTDNAKVKFFPMAYENQAYSSDDPLKLSNNHIYWQESPWIDSWLSGRMNVNGGGFPPDFTRGKFDDSLAYAVRDSDGKRLTALRGGSLDITPLENLSLTSTLATPKTLWQDYGDIDNIINATRVKYRLLDNLSLGSLFTYRLGLTSDKKRDFENYVWGFDFGYEIVEGMKIAMEAATSKTKQDIAFQQYRREFDGNAYNFTLMGTFPGQPIIDLKYGYDEIKPDKEQNFFAKYRFYVARMDKGFNPSLSDYRETRDDSYWSRHIHFRNAYEFFMAGISDAPLSWNDIEPYRIGNGIDIGRDVFGLRFETSLLDKRIYNLFDVRNVHKTNGKFVENVARDELNYRISNKLTSKFLGIYQRLPKTTAGLDPFIFDTVTGLPVTNTAILDGKNPTLKTGSLGLEYAFTDWIALSGIWERTNDYTLAYDNFPRGVLNNISLGTLTEYDQIFRQDSPYLYSQGLFPLPPYSFYNIWKTGLTITPIQKLQVYLDYTRNEFKSAGQIDNNINHVGMEVAYTPAKKFGIFFRYTYSMWNDLNRMLTGYDKIYLGHHNFFTEFRYLPSDNDELTFQYGESGISPIATTTYDPYGGSIATLDTRHIIRIYYRRKF